MPEHALLRDLVITYALALVLVVGLARLRIPSIVAFIVAGALAGPAGIGVVRTQEEVDTLANIGIVLLLFTVGLDFSLAQIRRIWKSSVLGGALQIAGTAVAVLLLFPLAGADEPWRVSVFIGLFVALSSTAIVLKELSARNQLDSPHGRLAVGLLLFQDLCILVLLLLVPILAGQTALTAVPLVLVRALLAIGAVAGVSRLVLPALLGIVARSGRREAFPLAVVLASIGTAWASSLLGISMALGAFLGGLMLAESEFSHQAHAEIRPLRDILAGLFFISLGMLVDLTLISRELALIATLTLVIIVVKATLATGALMVVGAQLSVAAMAGIGLAQIGEFSFVLGQAGLAAGLLTAAQWQTLLAASIATMVITPALIAAAPWIGSWIAAATKAGPAADGLSGIPRLTDHVVILGFGVGGQLLARALRDIGVPYLVLELNGATVRWARLEGESISFGDATNSDALRAAGVEHARAIVAVLSDPDASARAVKVARSLAPAVPIIVRTRYRTEAEVLLREGATIAVAEELEASFEVLAQLFSSLNVPGNLIEVLLDGFRRASTGLRPLRAPSQALESLPREISQMPIATHHLQRGDWAMGRTLADLNLRGETGALVIAIQRASQYFPSPPVDMRLDEGDVLYLSGDASDVLLARQHLKAGI